PNSLRASYSPYYYSSLPAITTFFFFTHPAPTDIYTLSLHDALPILSWQFAPYRGSEGDAQAEVPRPRARIRADVDPAETRVAAQDRKSTRLNSSHVAISYAVFCLKKKIMLGNIESTVQLTFSHKYCI